MKPGLAIAHALPAGPLTPAGREIPFPERSTVHRLKGLRQELFKKGRLTEALEVAERLMELAPGRESAWRLGVVQRELGQYQESLKTFRDALRYADGPAYVIPEIHLHAAFSWYRLREFKRMGECLGRVNQLRPKTRSDHNMHMSFGGYYMSRKAYAEARAEFEKAERAATTSFQRGRAVVNRGVAAYYLRDLPEAGRLLGKAIEIHKRARHLTELANARFLRAAFYLDEAQFGRAHAMFVRAARLFQKTGPKEKEANSWASAGYASVMLEDWVAAKPLLDRAALLARECQSRQLSVVALSLRAQVHARLDGFREASADLSQAKKALKGNRHYVSSAHVYRAQARIAELFGDWNEMRAYARKAERYAMREDDRPRVAEFRALRARAEHELGRRRAAFHARKTAAWVADLAGRGSKLMEAVRHDATRLARTELSLLITGESGTGKTGLAQEIHASSPRAKQPCVIVPCETLVFAASDLNGHAEGAWSGARSRAEGLVRKAAGGTLILDRVDEMDVDAQRVLLPVVDGRVRAVGSEVEERLDLRVLAVCRNPERLIPDLRRRLEGARLDVPPLRERAEDIPVLVRSMLDGRARITEDALALLAQQPWDGNLAELKGFVDRMVATSGGTLGIQAARAGLPQRPTRQVRQARELAGMAAALST
ncbi:MAG TPA: sigma 54-interacting transcriptional regulator [Planctomycetota bacterium]